MDGAARRKRRQYEDYFLCGEKILLRRLHTHTRKICCGIHIVNAPRDGLLYADAMGRKAKRGEKIINKNLRDISRV